MARSRLPGLFPRGCVVMAACLFLAAPASGGGDRQSAIVQNYDSSGTTVVKVLPDVGQEWTIYNSWLQNQVNGAVRYEDGSSNFLNCTPQRRTIELFELACRLYDQESQQWGDDPIVVENSTSFLNGEYENVYNSLFELPGEYTTTIEFPGFSQSYRLRMLDAGQSAAGFPFLLVTTNPPVLQSFLFRNTDLPDGTTELTNFTLGIQTAAYCIDLDLTPVAPGGTLAGTFGARENDDGVCGDVVGSDRSAALIPSGGEGVAGTYCEYIVDAIGSCSGPGPAVGSSVCIPCAGTYRSFGTLTALLPSGPGSLDYSLCGALQVSPAKGQSCSRLCSGTRVIGGITSSE